MLKELIIRNYALIEHISLKFSDKLNILTGETGAGKSIIIESLGLLLGERISGSVVRKGESKTSVTGIFEINRLKDILAFIREKNITVDDNTVILRREIDTSNKSKCYCNDEPVTVNFFEQLGLMLVDIHGQYEHQNLLKESNQLNLLDRYANLSELREKIKSLYINRQELTEQINSLKLNKDDKDRKIDMYKFQAKEIDDANLKPDENEKIEMQLPQLKNADKLLTACEEIYAMLSGNDTASNKSTLDMLYKTERSLESMIKLTSPESNASSQFNSMLNNITGIISQLKDVINEVGAFKSSLTVNPEELNKLIDRRDTILRLKRKYGATINDILEYKKRISSELNQLLHEDESVNELQKQLNKIEINMLKLCDEISEKRKKHAEKFQKSIETELTQLGMNKAKFRIGFDKETDPVTQKIKIYQAGYDIVKFLFSSNIGEDIKPLKNIASGGEMSRTMLAIKTVLGKTDNIPILVFDEIDSGVSGPMGQVIGKKLDELSGSHQVFCITHLAQIAAFAENQYYIFKKSDDNRTTTDVRELKTGEEKITELARMLSGENITDTARKHAKELITSAQRA